jgi:hypothetical protein
MKNTFRLVYLAVLFSAFSLAVQAQTPRPTPPTGDDTGAVKTFEVRLPVTVSDRKKKKNLVSGLSRGDLPFLKTACSRK